MTEKHLSTQFDAELTEGFRVTLLLALLDT